MRLLLMLFALFCLSCGDESNGDNAEMGGFAVPAVVAGVKLEKLVENLELVATLRANERVVVASEVDGVITKIGFDEGQRVQKGAALFVLDDAKLETELAAAEAEHALSSLNLERGKRLLADETLNQQDFDQLEARYLGNRARLKKAQEDMDDTQILAPFSGFMGSRTISEGQYVTRGTMLADLVDLDNLKVEAYVPERYIGLMKTGMSVTFRTVSFPDKIFSGTVYFLAPEVDALNRTLLIKARVDNTDSLLRPGMFGNMQLTVAEYDNAMTIPEAAISFNREGVTVMVVNESDQAELRTIEIGIRISGKAQIVSGLTSSDRVVVEGHQKLYPGAQVTVIEYEESP